MSDATPQPRPPGRPKGTGRPRNPTTTRCERLRNHLRAAGYPAVADYVEPLGDAVPAPFHDPDNGLFVFAMKVAQYGSSERFLFAMIGKRVVASEFSVNRLRPDPDADGASTVQISLRGMPKSVRASLVRAARHAGVTFPRYCISVLTAAASVADSRRAAGPWPALRSEPTESVREAIQADPDLGRAPDGDIAARWQCSTAYVQRIRSELGIPSSTVTAAIIADLPEWGDSALALKHNCSQAWVAKVRGGR